MNKASNRKTNTIQFHLCETLRGVKFIDRGRMVGTRGWGMGGVGSY